MKQLNKSCFIILMLFSACSKKEKEPDNLYVHNNQSSSFFSSAESHYDYNGMKLTLVHKPLDTLIKKQQFNNDSIYNVYKLALSKNIYFGFTIKPEKIDEVLLPQFDVSRMIERSYLISCGDTLNVLDMSVLQDFGLSKSKQFLLVYPQNNKHESCTGIVSIGGVFNAFDRYEFEFNAEDFK